MSTMVHHKIIGAIYRQIAKPLFFLIPPEDIHDFFLMVGHLLGKCVCAKKFLSILFSYQDKKLEQTILGIHFRNPVGLSEGYDKDAKLLEILPSVGFGFTQVGTVTLHPYEGNPKPRLVRLPLSKAILVNYGLKNIGIEKIIKRILSYKNINIPYSISIGKTNSCETTGMEDGIKDYVECYRRAADASIGDFYTINISCPNTFGGEPFATPEKLERLLPEMMKVQDKKPVFLKMPINLAWSEFKLLLDVAVKYKISGVIIGNLNKDHKDPSVIEGEMADDAKGGISGKPTWDLSNSLISQTYKTYGKSLVIIGVGGIFTASDAYEKIRRGASLIQLIAGLIYGGPQTVAQINEGLAKMMEKDGYKNIEEAVGTCNQ